MAGLRGKATALIGASGFADRVRELLRDAPAVHADETPARAAGGMRYVHLACTAYLTLMHTGDRSADAIDAGHVLPGYAGIIVRDGYSGYSHLTGALHAWCGAHLLRDLKDLYDFEPGKQDWASQVAALLIRPAAPRGTPARPGTRPWTRRSWAAWSPATGHSPRTGWRRTSTGAPPPPGTPAGSPAGS
jgi:transposase